MRQRRGHELQATEPGGELPLGAAATPGPHRTLLVLALAAGVATAAAWGWTILMAREHLLRGEALLPARRLEAVRELQTSLLLRSPGNHYAAAAALRLREVQAAAEAAGDARLAGHVREVLETAPRATESLWDGRPRAWLAAGAGAFLLAWLLLVARLARGEGMRGRTAAAALLCYAAWLVTLWLA